MSFCLRMATKNDKLEIAKAMVAASGGICDFLLGHLPAPLSPHKILSLEVARDESRLSYRNALIASLQQTVMGVMLFYDWALLTKPTEQRLIDTTKLDCFKPFYDFELQNTYYIDTVYVHPAHRGQGLGKQMIAWLENHILKNQSTTEINQLSLYVWANNRAAIQLYRRVGFDLYKSIHSLPHPEFAAQERWLMLKKL